MMHHRIIAALSLLLVSPVIGFSVNRRSNRQTVIGPSALFAEQNMQSAEIEDVTQTEATKATVRCPDCDLCDGSGRILGGIATVLEWWPIKAYRPCPNFVDRGGKYVRSGQGLDEIAFGRIQND